MLLNLYTKFRWQPERFVVTRRLWEALGCGVHAFYRVGEESNLSTNIIIMLCRELRDMFHLTWLTTEKAVHSLTGALSMSTTVNKFGRNTRVMVEVSVMGTPTFHLIVHFIPECPPNTLLDGDPDRALHHLMDRIDAEDGPIGYILDLQVVETDEKKRLRVPTLHIEDV
ncbi:hypothetical protein CAPTEDRAFT_207127 [Capitella teleta]|uniref:Uncharacterized protein n=1 Tax=Capitella teleta TaxID=283909 RepID=R7U1H8_CAPTE|nr:hypothetical protein CAPTEDRAFT_207127 [Capitella teleta]|eukprot:ELT97050.1 hypothetical protein CAPTEDRAFT_207127 [Capitella teleta]